MPYFMPPSHLRFGILRDLHPFMASLFIAHNPGSPPSGCGVKLRTGYHTFGSPMACSASRHWPSQVMKIIKNGRGLHQIPTQIRAVYYFHHLQVAPTGGANKRWPVFAANPRQGWAIVYSRRLPEQRGLAGRSFTRTIQKHGTREIAKRRGHGLVPESKYHCNLGLV